MRSFLLTLLAAAAIAPAALAAEDLPPVEAFQVFEQALPAGPRITPYLQYQAEQAWKQDDQRRAAWAAIRDEKDLLRVQDELRKKTSADDRRLASEENGIACAHYRQD